MWKPKLDEYGQPQASAEHTDEAHQKLLKDYSSSAALTGFTSPREVIDEYLQYLAVDPKRITKFAPYITKRNSLYKYFPSAQRAEVAPEEPVSMQERIVRSQLNPRGMEPSAAAAGFGMVPRPEKTLQRKGYDIPDYDPAQDVSVESPEQEEQQTLQTLKTARGQPTEGIPTDPFGNPVKAQPPAQTPAYPKPTSVSPPESAAAQTGPTVGQVGPQAQKKEATISEHADWSQYASMKLPRAEFAEFLGQGGVGSGQGLLAVAGGASRKTKSLPELMKSYFHKFNSTKPLRVQTAQLSLIYVGGMNPKVNKTGDTSLRSTSGPHKGQKPATPVDKLHAHPKQTVNDGNLG
jgi:hypothetical protein